MLGDAVELPNQVNNEVDGNLFIHSNIQINQKAPSFDKHNSDVYHAVDAYTNQFCENKKDSDNDFYEYTYTQELIDDKFIIPAPKRSRRLRFITCCLD